MKLLNECIRIYWLGWRNQNSWYVMWTVQMQANSNNNYNVFVTSFHGTIVCNYDVSNAWRRNYSLSGIPPTCRKSSPTKFLFIRICIWPESKANKKNKKIIQKSLSIIVCSHNPDLRMNIQIRLIGRMSVQKHTVSEKCMWQKPI